MKVSTAILLLLGASYVSAKAQGQEECVAQNKKSTDGAFKCMVEKHCKNAKVESDGLNVNLNKEFVCNVTPDLEAFPGAGFGGTHQCTEATLTFDLTVPEAFNDKGGIKLPGFAGTNKNKEHLVGLDCVAGNSCDDAFSTRLQMHPSKVMNLYYYPETNHRDLLCKSFKADGKYFHDGEWAGTCKKDKIGISIKGNGKEDDGPVVTKGEVNRITYFLSVKDKKMTYELTISNSKGTDRGTASWDMGDQFYINTFMGSLHYGSQNKPEDSADQTFIVNNIKFNCGKSGGGEDASPAPSPSGDNAPAATGSDQESEGTGVSQGSQGSGGSSKPSSGNKLCKKWRKKNEL